MNFKDIDIKDYNYSLTDDRIAQYPEKERDMSKLLVWKNDSILQAGFRDVGLFLPKESFLVFNNSRVIRARLLFGKSTGARIEILCLEPLEPPEYEASFSSSGPIEWKCIIGNLKKWKKGPVFLDFESKGIIHRLSAERICEEGDAWRIRFSWQPPLTFAEITEAAGHVPLPPYISRKDEESDAVDYQTVYSRIKGSVAAPTAGLHFTANMLESLKKDGIGSTEITLHVGAGTFQPVKAERISEHEMHSERFLFTADALEAILNHEDNIIAVGTTSVRTLESIYWLGVKTALNKEMSPFELYLDQWEAYSSENSISVSEALNSLLIMMKRNKLLSLYASTKLIIIPGYKFRMIKGMITNFHQPGSTLLLLVSAFTGEKWKDIYSYALENGFRFLSYGDSSLLLRS